MKKTLFLSLAAELNPLLTSRFRHKAKLSYPFPIHYLLSTSANNRNPPSHGVCVYITPAQNLYIVHRHSNQDGFKLPRKSSQQQCPLCVCRHRFGYLFGRRNKGRKKRPIDIIIFILAPEQAKSIKKHVYIK